ncbi:MAG: YifB family Mg chelatase-like AAA ATPase [Pseudomonadota bacterium]
MVRTRTVVGVNALPVIVEVHLANGLPAFSTVGLPEAAVRESKGRVRGAILNCGFEFPAKRITVNLSPADLPKTGSRFDLPIAIGILVASGQIKDVDLDQYEFVGELALDGQIRKISGVLPTALRSHQARKQLVVPQENFKEASLVAQSSALSGTHLLEVCRHLCGQEELLQCKAEQRLGSPIRYPDLREVKGQPHAKRALEVAAAGGHSLLMMGPPGTGKSMLAARMPGLLPVLSDDEAIQSAAIQSVAKVDFGIESWKERPIRSPHHSASAVALVGGGSNPRPGEVSLAHNGILFLDELTEFSRVALEQLREPLETGVVNIARANHNTQFPAKFMLVAACNPCKCGYAGDGTNRCQCSIADIERYRAKLSGPLLDRIDIHLKLHRLDIRDMHLQEPASESSEAIRARVTDVRDWQTKHRGKLNCDLSGEEIDGYCSLNASQLDFFTRVCDKLNLSARAYHRILRLARTIADMEGANQIATSHLSEAIGYRGLDRM